jgi:hypothetical protein
MMRLRLPPPPGAVDHHATWHEGRPGLHLRRQLFKVRPGEIPPKLSLRPPGGAAESSAASRANERLRLDRDTFEPDPRTYIYTRDKKYKNNRRDRDASTQPKHATTTADDAAAVTASGDADAPSVAQSELRRQWIAIGRKFDERHPDPSVVDREPVVFDRSWRTARAPPLVDRSGGGVSTADFHRTTVIVDDADSDQHGANATADRLTLPEVTRAHSTRSFSLLCHKSVMFTMVRA